MKLITKTSTIGKAELLEMAGAMFGNLVKAVVDINKEIMVIDAELHADEEQYLLSQGSVQKYLWGVNLYPELEGGDFIEFDSLINLRPSQNNNSRGVDDYKIRQQIRDVVLKLVK